MLAKGQKAPYFEGKDENGNVVKLSDFVGKKLVLYFYPKDSTPQVAPQKLATSATTIIVSLHWVTMCWV